MTVRSSTPGARDGAWREVLDELFGRLLYPSRYLAASAAAPHVRSTHTVERLLALFVLASIPAALTGSWSLGGHVAAGLAEASVHGLPGWRGLVFGMTGLSIVDPGVGARLLVGLLFFVPLLATALLVSILFEVVFAVLRRRPVDPGWLMTAWLYTLLLPATVPAALAALGIGFGLVFGKHIFGGTGRYIVSPAALGVVFLTFGYPGYFAADQFVPLSTASSGWAAVAAGGVAAAQNGSMSWISSFVGTEIGAIGTPSAAACLLGAAVLVAKGTASPRIVLGALAGAWLMASIVIAIDTNDPAWQIPWHWHLTLGSFAFAVAFLATDPTTAALTPLGRWIQGGLIGGLIILIRVLNPAHPEGTLFAIVLGSLFTPLIDHIVVRYQLTRWKVRQ